LRVAVYYSNEDVRIEERPVPRISRGEILVRMMAAGICGTDVMQWYRRKTAPRVLGHEMAGEIADVGDGVECLRKGERVFVSHHVPCYECSYCVEGNYTACEALHAGNYDPGGFSEFIRVPERNVESGTFQLPGAMSYEEATMIEPLACVVLGQRQLALHRDQTVLIIGSGISGLLHLLLAKSRGATVIATDINKYRLEKASEFGADHVIDASRYSIEKLKKVTDGKLAERVIVCAGAKQAVEHAASSVDRRGRILFFAVPEGEISLPSMRFWRDEITVTFSYGASPEDLREAIALIENVTVNVKSMITHTLPLSRIQEGFKLVASAGDSLKVVIVPDGSPRE